MMFFLAAALLFLTAAAFCAAEGETLPTAEELVKAWPVSPEQIEMNPNGDPLLILVNKQVELSSRYVPDVVNVNVPWKYDNDPVQMVPEAAAALEELVAAATREGFDLKAISGYRSYSRQKRTYAQSLQDPSSGGAVLNAKEGCSEHQTGLAVDISGKEARWNEVQYYGETPSGMWLSGHCADFGFIIRYRTEWRPVTGYVAEPWHLRYVGKVHAAAVMKMNVPFELYLDYLKLSRQMKLSEPGTEDTFDSRDAAFCLSASGSVFLYRDRDPASGTAAELKNGTEVRPALDKDGWVLVSVNGKSGYVRSEELYAESLNRAANTTRKVKLRSAASSEASAVMTVDSGVFLRIQQILDGEWAFVRVKGEYGFINVKYLE